MHRLVYPGIRLPEVYVCDNKGDSVICRDAGIPYIVTRLTDEQLVRTILYHWLRGRFPHIDWASKFGYDAARPFAVIVPCAEERPTEMRAVEEPTEAEAPEESEGDETAPVPEVRQRPKDEIQSTVTNGYRIHEGTEGVRRVRRVMSDDFFADEGNKVNVEQLQALGLLPQFMSDVADAIKLNLMSSMRWRECYNKRLGECVGDYSLGTKAPNLIILDISGSIPRGISQTMLQLVDTLRGQAEADLIVTGGSSYYWSAGEDLPTPQWIRDHISFGNETVMFMRIVRERLAGRHFGNVISFGDNDSPGYAAGHMASLMTVRVDRVMHYHTWREDRETGYARWVRMANPDAEQVFDTSWCDMMVR